MKDLHIVFAGPEFPASREHLSTVLPDVRVSYLTDSSSVPLGIDADVLIPLIARIDAPVIERVDGLRLIQQWGAGLEGVDREAATAAGVAVGNVPTDISANADSVAEWCVMCALALSRQLRRLENGIRSGETWGSPLGRTLLGKTAGIVGLGGIGNALAKRLAVFGMHVVAITRQPYPDRATALGLDWVLGSDSLEQLLSVSDYVFLCVPLTESTRHLINATTVQALRDGACLINAGRGALIDDDAVLGALSSGQLLGVGLDVYVREPVDPDHPLLAHPAVLATPHVAGVTDSSYQGIARRVAETIGQLVAGEPLVHCVNWEQLKDRFYEAE
jgi:phosphoglycerate dehydrogenase-like enzyme